MSIVPADWDNGRTDPLLGSLYCRWFCTEYISKIGSPLILSWAVHGSGQRGVYSIQYTVYISPVGIPYGTSTVVKVLQIELAVTLAANSDRVSFPFHLFFVSFSSSGLRIPDFLGFPISPS
jgi:hypothetical protein